MASYRFELASREDDSQLRESLARNKMSGAISLSFRREPSYFAACQLDGDESQTIVCLEVESNKIVGLGSRSIRNRYCQGQVERIGYLSTLRLDEAHRRRGLVARGFRFFRDLDTNLRDTFQAKYYVTTIADRNSTAEQTLLGGRAGLPHYRRVATWNTYSVSLRRCRCSSVDGIQIRSLEKSALDKVVDFLNEFSSKRNLSPKYCKQDFEPSVGTFRDLEQSQVFVAWKGSDIVGTFAIWDQSTFKQVVVEGYSSFLRCCRPLYNAWAKWKGDPVLPKPGEIMKHFVGSLLVVRDNRIDVARSLVATASLKYSATPYRLLLGFDSRCPLASTFAARASHVYTTGVYLVSWDPTRWTEYDTDRLIYLELGCL